MSLYRQSTSTSTPLFGTPSQSQQNYFLSSPTTSPISGPGYYHQQQSSQSASMHHPFHSTQQSFGSSQFQHSFGGGGAQHQQSFSGMSSGRKSGGLEPMNTSPIAQPQSPHYLPSFLTAAPQIHPNPHSLNLNMTAPQSSNIFDNTEVNPDRTASIPTQNQPSGPPLTGLGGTSGIGSSTAAFEQSLAAAGSVNANLMNQRPTFPAPASPLAGNWVTVFGFPTSALTYVLTNFGEIGAILETKANPGANWLHIRYSNKIEAKKALSRNGTVLGGTMMIGVIPYNVESGDITQHQRQMPSTSSGMNKTSSAMDNTNFNMSNIADCSISSSRKENLGTPGTREVKSRIRPLAPKVGTTGPRAISVPREESGFLAQAVDYLFGW